MGRVLQIRVQASTWDPARAEKTWPRLWKLAWPSEAYGLEGPGVLQLVEALDEQRRFGPWSQETKDALEAGLDRALSQKGALDQALADWNPREANRLSDDLEETLDELERAVPR